MREASQFSSRIECRLKSHLARVAQALERAGMPHSERAGIIADIRSQFAEMLASRADGKPTMDDAEAVLYELDPPEAFAHRDPAEPGERGRAPSPEFVRGFGLTVLAMIAVGLVEAVLLGIAFVLAIPIGNFADDASRTNSFTQALQNAYVWSLAILIWLATGAVTGRALWRALSRYARSRSP